MEGTESRMNEQLGDDPRFDVSDHIIKLVIQPSQWWGEEIEGPCNLRRIRINSHVLSSKSQFFSKLFTIGMMESTQTESTLSIHASEEASVRDLLRFMYSSKFVAAVEACELFDLLVLADKYDVPSCREYCVQQLLSFSLTTESSLQYLNLHWTLLLSPEVKPLIEASQRVVAAHYRDINEHRQEEIMSLPFFAVEGILSSDELLIAHENYVYDIIMAWTEHNYPKEEHGEILESLALCVRFPWVSPLKLEEIAACGVFKSVSKLVLEALLFKNASRPRQASLASSRPDHMFVERRTYKYRLIKLLEFQQPHEQRIVYLDLSRNDCKDLFPSNSLYSQGLSIAGHRLHLCACCNTDEQGVPCFGCFIVQANVSETAQLDYDMAVRSSKSEDFVELHRGVTMTGDGEAVGCVDLFGLPWTRFISPDSLYFINDTLHLRVDISIL